MSTRRSSMWQALQKQARQSVTIACSVLLLALSGLPVQARGPLAEHDAVALKALPPEAQRTQRLIEAGGPFPYQKDGVVFGNRERQLPARQRGFYREYTVPTPGARNRGAQRIVCGGNQPRQPDVCYYTADHYASFQRIVN